ncbi:helix-turn-helix transcriptional regulator [Amycolatopsis sp. Hca4]|uniref:helix-turn-helix domain-containing protein n=1 Tax=unclassified Amycolatopsis TaxID=2618356 RepID=UPI0015903EF6|nr:helix-turn-helix transcriptional regulator [Amycolatopsis sp. Hca4]QKV74873.1 helix-turn-helix domain-containing protein [Amycolatopsis sp. Hca4]
MPPPIATPRARALGFGMKRARQARNLKVRELGRLVDVLPQNISNWESGKRVPKIDELATILGALRVEPAERARLINLARTATDPNWLDQHAVDGPERLATYLEYERAAASMACWAPAVVPGMLQTPAYIRAIFATMKHPTAHIERHVMVRLARRDLLTGRNPLSCRILLSEAVLHQNIGGPAVMAEQLTYLRSRMRLPSVSVRIVRNGIGYHPGHFGPFIVFDYTDLPSLVYLEHHRGSGYVYDEDDVAGYRAAIDTLSSLALSELDSERLIQGVITGLEA